MRVSNWMIAGAAALALGGCLGGKKVPPVLLTLSSSVPNTAVGARSGEAGQAVTIRVPVIPKELNTTRVPVQAGPTSIAYIKDVMWVETPDRMLQHLISETVLRTTGRVVLDPKQASLDPGLSLDGTLTRMGYDARERAVIVRYDGALSTMGGTRVETRRFEAKVPSSGDAKTVGPALNAAANKVAQDVARWIGG